MSLEYAHKYFPTHLRGCKSTNTVESRDHNGLSRLLQQPTDGLNLLCKFWSFVCFFIHKKLTLLTYTTKAYSNKDMFIVDLE